MPTEPGCCPCHRGITIGDWRDPLDPYLDAQVLYSQYQQGREALTKNYSPPPSEEGGGDGEDPSSSQPAKASGDSSRMGLTYKRLVEVLDELAYHHSQVPALWSVLSLSLSLSLFLFSCFFFSLWLWCVCVCACVHVCVCVAHFIIGNYYYYYYYYYLGIEFDNFPNFQKSKILILLLLLLLLLFVFFQWQLQCLHVKWDRYIPLNCTPQTRQKLYMYMYISAISCSFIKEASALYTYPFYPVISVRWLYPSLSTFIICTMTLIKINNHYYTW